MALMLALALNSCTGQQRVLIAKTKESVSKHVYDRGNRPESQVELHPSVEANTHWEFQFVPEIHVTRTKLARDKDESIAAVRVESVKIELALPIDVWLPESASEKVIEHEGGHISICKHFYEDADQVARQAAIAICNQEFSGRGKSDDECTRDAIEAASNAISRAYQEKIVHPAERASEVYDRLTAHGQNTMPVKEAVEQSIAAARP